jgi:N-acetyl-gamma-glutamyl-phosphate/LysW-gamma-L-alpha-aminoadipyl-6-phosphate reductase
VIRVGIVGASGYTGGDLLRWLIAHPEVEVTQITSESNAGKFAYQVHPHLRGQVAAASLRFIGQDALTPCDLLFLALPHGEASARIDHYAALAPRIIDLSADFRLRDPAAYRAAYRADHPAPAWLARFVYGLPEIGRDAICTADYVSGVGCNATATILALWALLRAGLLSPDQPLIVDLKVGSSEAGRTPSESSHHPIRAGVVRPFALTGHRHEAEVRQAFADSGARDVRMAITSVELVRGVSAAAHVTLATGLAEKDIWAAYRAAWTNPERPTPFVRIVHERGGLHRHPEPRVVAGTNLADVGWEYDPATGRAVLLCAVDNLGKGAAGNAVQCMNLMYGFDETAGLDFRGFYP